MTDNKIVDCGDLRKYRTEIPNLVCDMGLSVYARCLYLHLKRVAGGGVDGVSRQGTRTIAESCSMSMAKVSEAKQELVRRGLISITRYDQALGLADEIYILDIWAENFAVYSKKHMGPLKERIAATCSLIEQGGGGTCSPHEHKKEHVLLSPNKRQTLDDKLRSATRRKRVRARHQKQWLVMRQDELQLEITKYKNFLRAKPGVLFFRECIDFLERIID